MRGTSSASLGNHIVTDIVPLQISHSLVLTDGAQISAYFSFFLHAPNIHLFFFLLCLFFIAMLTDKHYCCNVKKENGTVIQD